MMAPRRLAIAASLLTAAVLYTLACPPYEWSSAAWLVPGLVLVPARRLRPRAALLFGTAFGMLMAGGITGWALHATLEYFDFDRLASGAFVLAVWLVYAGLPFGLLVGSYALAAPRLPAAARGPLGAWLWVAAEWLRATLFTGMPWELLGHTQFRNLALIQVADLGGVYAVSFVIALASVSAGELLADLRRQPSAWGLALRRTALPASLLAATLLYGLHARHAAAATSQERPTTVALIQGNVPNELRWKRAHFEKTLLAYAQLTRAAAARGTWPDLIVWPENAVGFYLDREPMLQAQLGAVAGLARNGLLLGGPRMTADGRVHNSAHLIGADGRTAGTYDKRRLVPFAEYQPLGTPAVVDRDGPATFTAGTSAMPLQSPGASLGALICYEVLFPNLARELVHRGAEVLINLSNDSWLDGGDGAASQQHFSMAVFRAIETRRYLVRASASGVSGFIDPYGRGYSTIEANTAGASVATVWPRHGESPYVRWGDLWIGLGVLAATSAVVRRGAEDTP